MKISDKNTFRTTGIASFTAVPTAGMIRCLRVLLTSILPPLISITTAAQNLVKNPEFKDSSVWTLSGAFRIGAPSSRCRSCPGFAYVQANNVQGKMSQDITLPPTPSGHVLTFWYYITTAEIAPNLYDTLNVYVRDNKENPHTVAALSEADATTGYVMAPRFDLTAFSGETVTLEFHALTDPTDLTTFRIDDVSVEPITCAFSLVSPLSMAVLFQSEEARFEWNTSGDCLTAYLAFGSSASPQVVSLPVPVAPSPFTLGRSFWTVVAKPSLDKPAAGAYYWAIGTLSAGRFVARSEWRPFIDWWDLRFRLERVSEPTIGGTIIATPSPGPDDKFSAGTAIHLTVEPDPRFRFAAWEFRGSGGSEISYNNESKGVGS